MRRPGSPTSKLGASSELDKLKKQIAALQQKVSALEGVVQITPNGVTIKSDMSVNIESAMTMKIQSGMRMDLKAGQIHLN